MGITLDPLAILERHIAVLRLRDLSFEEKVGYITAKEATEGLAPERLPMLAGAIRNIMLGNQSKVLKEVAARVPPPNPPRHSPHIPAAPMTRGQILRDIDELNEKMRSVDFNDQYAADNLVLWGKRLESLKKRLTDA